MKILITLVFVITCQITMAQSLRDALLSQLHSSHDHAEWFVPANTAVAGLTAEQASWKDGNGNHSVGQLTYHIVYWNKNSLEKMMGKTPTQPNSNEDTFASFDAKQWADLVKQLDEVMVGLEKFVMDADEKVLNKNAATLSNIALHNAYHVGQIVTVRKAQKVWDPKKGVN